MSPASLPDCPWCHEFDPGDHWCDQRAAFFAETDE